MREPIDFALKVAEKFDPRSFPGGHWSTQNHKNLSESCTGASWGPSGCLVTPGGQCLFPFNVFCFHKGRPEEAFGIQKIAKTTLGRPKRRSQEQSTDHFFISPAAKTVFYYVSIDGCSLFNEKPISKTIYLFTAVCDFCNLAAFTKHHISSRSGATFFSFCLFVLFAHCHRKFDPKLRVSPFSQKSEKRCLRGASLRPKMVPN